MKPINIFLSLVIVFSLAVVLPAAEKTGPPRRPNILWLIGENIDLDLGCYGAKLVRTPNLDGLAASGVRFTQVFSTSPVCAPTGSTRTR